MHYGVCKVGPTYWGRFNKTITEVQSASSYSLRQRHRQTVAHILPAHAVTNLNYRKPFNVVKTYTFSALEALRNALYKFKTYLLTYLLVFS